MNSDQIPIQYISLRVLALSTWRELPSEIIKVDDIDEL